MTKNDKKIGGKILEYIAVFALALIFFYSKIDAKFDRLYCSPSTLNIAKVLKKNFHPDENMWIAQSFFLEVFVAGNFSHEIWKDNVPNLMQFPFVKYIIGMGRLLGGYYAKDLNLPAAWIWGFGPQVDKNRKAYISKRLLFWSRLPMCIMAAFSIFLLWKLLLDMRGRLAAYFFLVVCFTSSYLPQYLNRAMAESPFLFFFILAIIAIYEAILQWNKFVLTGRSFDVRMSTFWFIVAASMTTFSGLCKANGFMTIIAVVSIMLYLAITDRKKIRQSTQLKFMLITFTSMTVVSLFIFIASNPFLYYDTLNHIWAVPKVRLEIMQAQVRSLPDECINGIVNRVVILTRRIFQDYAALSFSGAWVLNYAFFFTGLVIVIKKAKLWMEKKESSAMNLVLLVVCFTTVSPSLLTPLDWGRYYLLPVVFSFIYIAIGMEVVTKFGIRFFRSRSLVYADPATS